MNLLLSKPHKSVQRNEYFATISTSSRLVLMRFKQPEPELCCVVDCNEDRHLKSKSRGLIFIRIRCRSCLCSSLMSQLLLITHVPDVCTLVFFSCSIRMRIAYMCSKWISVRSWESVPSSVDWLASFRSNNWKDCTLCLWPIWNRLVYVVSSHRYAF